MRINWGLFSGDYEEFMQYMRRCRLDELPSRHAMELTNCLKGILGEGTHLRLRPNTLPASRHRA